MAVTYTDAEIAALIAEPKPIFMNQWRVTHKRSHREESMDIQGDAGNEFRIIRRTNKVDELDFSIILGAILPRTRQIFACCAMTAITTNIQITLSPRDSSTSISTALQKDTKKVSILTTAMLK